MAELRKSYMSKEELRRYLSQLENQASVALAHHNPSHSNDRLLHRSSSTSLSMKSATDSPRRKSPTRQFIGKAGNENTDYERFGISNDGLAYESLEDHMGMRFSNPSRHSHTRVKSAPNDTDSTYSSSRGSSEYDQLYNLSPHPDPIAKKPLPLIHFPKDHPYYQGEPPNTAVSNLDPRVNTPSNRNTCAQCHKSLSSTKMILKALGNKYHPQCFQCSHCSLSLEHAAFYPHEGRVYCHLDYHELFSPRCKHCQTPIEDEVITAMGSTYHVGHFFCAGCSKPFSSTESYHARDDYAWCHNCFTNKYSIKCWKCEKTIPEGDVIIKVLGRDWCSVCFSCEECTTPFGDDGFILRDDGTLVCVGCEEEQLKRYVYSL